jgi:catechol 2,3-dioxygenase-like lactoylglutathione lyase family enzyme
MIGSRRNVTDLAIERFTFGVNTDQLAACREFYVRLFGFRVVFEQSWFVHLRSAGDECDIGLLHPRHPDLPAAFAGAFAGTGAWISFNVPNVGPLVERCQSLDIPLEFDVRDEAWGERHFGVRDPAGVLINIAQRIAPFGDYARSTGNAST